MTGRDFYCGTAREQLIEELEIALKKAKDLNNNKVDFCILDHDISYFFNGMGEDIIEPKVCVYERHLLCVIDSIHYYLEPKNNGFTMARYNNAEQQLERLCDSLTWYYGARDGKKFFSIQEIIEFLTDYITTQVDKDLIINQCHKILAKYPKCFPWFRD